jgi:hypothetical protein
MADVDAAKKDDFDWDQALDDENDPNFDPCAAKLEGTAKILRKWQLRLGGNKEQVPWTDAEHLAYLFQRFRPDGNGIEEFCADMQLGLMAPRLLEIFHATSDGYKNGDTVDGYFIVRKPLKASNADLQIFAKKYFFSINRVAESLGPTWRSLRMRFANPPQVSVIRGQEAPRDTSEMGGEIYDTLNEFYRRLEPKNENLGLLREALYSMANDHTLANYVRWPIAEAHFKEEQPDPFKLYFKLWLRGVEMRFLDEGTASDWACNFYIQNSE